MLAVCRISVSPSSIVYGANDFATPTLDVSAVWPVVEIVMLVAESAVIVPVTLLSTLVKPAHVTSWPVANPSLVKLWTALWACHSDSSVRDAKGPVTALVAIVVWVPLSLITIRFHVADDAP